MRVSRGFPRLKEAFKLKTKSFCVKDRNMRRPIKLKLAFAVVVLLGHGLVLSNFSLADSADKTPALSESDTIDRIVVIPFQNMMQAQGINRTVRGPVTRKVFITGMVAPEAELIMDHELQKLLSHNGATQWHSLDVAEAAHLFSHTHSADLIKQLQILGQREKADAVLVGYLYAFREREGGDYGAQTPAHVAFELALVHVESGAIMWRKGFSETQRALNENLLEIGKFIKRKGRWVTARDMGRQAMQQMLKTLPRAVRHTAQ